MLEYMFSYDVASGSEITPSDLQIFGERYDVLNNIWYLMTKL